MRISSLVAVTGTILHSLSTSTATSNLSDCSFILWWSPNNMRWPVFRRLLQTSSSPCSPLLCLSDLGDLTYSVSHESSSFTDIRFPEHYYFIYFVCFFVALGKRVNFILVTPSWLDVEGHFLNFRGLLLSLAQTPLHFDEVSLEHFPISHFCLKIYPDLCALSHFLCTLMSLLWVMHSSPLTDCKIPDGKRWVFVSLLYLCIDNVDKLLSLKTYPPDPISMVLTSQYFYFYHLNHL